jgi:hypothetical protein
MLNNDLGERVNLIPFFLQDQERFLIQAIEAYSVIVNYIEYSRNATILANTYNMGIAFMVDKDRWMNLVNLKMISVDNPLSWLIKRPSLNYSRIVQFLDGRDIRRDFNEPQIFSINEKSGHMTYYCATSKDILSLLNINLNRYVPITSMFAVQLLGSCLLKALGFEVKTEFLPSTAIRYYTVDSDGNPAKNAWDRDELTGNVYELSMMSMYLEKELGSALAGEFLPEFEGMRLT